jgi:hypothetical protein
VDVPASSLTEEAVKAAIDQVVDFALEPEVSKEHYVHGALAKAILRQQLFGDMYTTPLLKKLQPCSLLSAQAGECPPLPGLLPLCAAGLACCALYCCALHEMACRPAGCASHHRVSYLVAPPSIIPGRITEYHTWSHHRVSYLVAQQ